MVILDIAMLFIFPANVILLALLNINKKNINKPILLILSYGTGPLISGLLFYYLITLFPQRENLFYVSFVLFFWMVIVSIFSKKIIGWLSFYKESFLETKKYFTKENILIFLPIVIFIFIYAFQVFGFPIVEGDSAFYINESKCYYTYKNLNWKDDIAIINFGNNNEEEYYHNTMIGPGIPSFMALSFSINSNQNNYFAYNFLMFFYYLLLFFIFLFLIKEFAIELEKPVFPALFFGSLLFVFSWFLTRTIILGLKEPIIYFLTLLSIYFILEIKKIQKRNLFLESVLGVTLGLNTFVNVHGIIILVILLTLLLIFSKLEFAKKMKQLFFVFGIHLFVGAFEFFTNFQGIFLSTLDFIIEKINHGKQNFSIVSFLQKFNEHNISTEKIPISLYDEDSLKMNMQTYQFNNLGDIYIRGKLQLITNIGVFGFDFWLFVAILVKKSKKLLSLKFSKFLIAFMGLYIFIVIDPFNLNKNPNAVVLSGSTKYAGLIMLVSLMVVSVYASSILQSTFSLMVKKIKAVSFLLTTLLIVLFTLRKNILSLGLEILSSSTPFYKDITFYKEKIELFYLFLALFLIISLVSIFLIIIKKVEFSKYLLTFNLVVFFVLIPFFITNAGKVPFEKTFSFIGKSDEEKFVNISNIGDLYKAYYFAKNNLPEDSVVFTTFNEIYIYNDSLFFTKHKPNGQYYIIKNACDPVNGEGIIYSVGSYAICFKEN